jgi:hypothetical protein
MSLYNEGASRGIGRVRKDRRAGGCDPIPGGDGMADRPKAVIARKFPGVSLPGNREMATAVPMGSAPP